MEALVLSGQQCLKGRTFAYHLDLEFELARFEADDLYARVRAITQERPNRPLPERVDAITRAAVRRMTEPDFEFELKWRRCMGVEPNPSTRNSIKAEQPF